MTQVKLDYALSRARSSIGSSVTMLSVRQKKGSFIILSFSKHLSGNVRFIKASLIDRSSRHDHSCDQTIALCQCETWTCSM